MSILESAKASLEGSSSLQQAVRDVLSDPELTNNARKMNIVTQVEAFKEWAMEQTSDDPTYQKKVNNIINDISRICTDKKGFAVRLQSRRSGYTYKTVDVEFPPVKAKKAILYTPTDLTGKVNLLTDEGLKSAVKVIPIKIMTEFLRQYDKSELSDIMKKALRDLDSET